MNEMWWSVLDCLIIILEWLFCYELIKHVAIPKKNKLVLGVQLLLMIVVGLLDYILQIDANIRILICILLGVLFMKYNYAIQLKKAIIISMFFWLLVIGTEALGMVAIFIGYQLSDIGIVLGDSMLKIQAIAISKVFLYISVWVLCRFFGFYEELPKKYFLYILIPITTNILNLFIMFSNLTIGASIFSNRILLATGTLLIIASTIVFILLAGNLIKENKIKAEYTIIQEKIDMQYKYYIGLEEEQQKVRKLYHDMRNHISCIQLLANNKAANAYIKKIENELSGIKKYYDTGNPILDIILDDKSRECSEKGIDFVSEINFEKCAFIEMIDVTSLFSNILNNAIEACEKIGDKGIEKKIKLKSTYVDNFFVLVATNSKINKVRMNGKRLITDKEDHFVHGLGVNNIMTAANKYNGEVAIEHTDYEFVVKVLIPLQKEAQAS